jgi:hypothetical protein
LFRNEHTVLLRRRKKVARAAGFWFNPPARNGKLASTGFCGT